MKKREMDKCTALAELLGAATHHSSMNASRNGSEIAMKKISTVATPSQARRALESGSSTQRS